MNANELANYWMNRKFAVEMADETSDMLRQQQAEIDALHRFIDERGETGQLIIWKAQEK